MDDPALPEESSTTCITPADLSQLTSTAIPRSL